MFLKPTSSYLENGGKIEVPPPLESLDHEVELAVVIGQRARDVSEASAMNYVGGFFKTYYDYMNIKLLSLSFVVLLH